MYEVAYHDMLKLVSARTLPNWDSPPLHTQAIVECIPSFVPGGGGAPSLAGEGVGGPNSNEGTDTVVLQA
jgi:hypothetical protein